MDPRCCQNSSISTFGKLENWPGTVRFGPFKRETEARNSLIQRGLMLQASVRGPCEHPRFWVPVNWACG